MAREKTVTYEGPDGAETTAVEDLGYDEITESWRFERELDGEIETVQLPQKRLYRITHTREVEGQTGRDEYGHP
ncbi:MAG: hypothetical protein IH933_05395 [Euryarchaeota archaeon]|jgi:hypothetical protein|nr:hypothetical protein [Euryarchaeota archaeon]